MTNQPLPKGYFNKILIMDCETTGINIDVNVDDPSIGYQAVSWGLLVVDTNTMKILDELYVEIKWNGEAKWDKKSEKVHGLSKEYLEANGLTEEEAIVEIANFVYKYWPPNSEFSFQRTVRCAGYNVSTFDVFFMRQLFRKFGLEFRTGNRFIDTNSIAFATLGTYNSDDAFEMIGIKREKHNALDDARASYQLIKTIRTLYKTMIGE